jgi:hypothetical protein
MIAIVTMIPIALQAWVLYNQSAGIDRYWCLSNRRYEGFDAWPATISPYAARR